MAVHLLLVFLLATGNFLEKLDNRFALGIYTRPELTRHYFEMLSYHLRMEPHIEPGSVIFIGDSHTQGLNVAAVTPQSINYGIGGDTSIGVLQRLPHYKSIQHAKAVVLEIGFNDLSKRNDAKILLAYEKIQALIPPPIPLVICAIFPVDENVIFTGLNKRIQSLNQATRRLYSNRKNTIFIDIGEHLANEDGHLKSENHVGDGIHLSGRGYTLWIDALKKALYERSS